MFRRLKTSLLVAAFALVAGFSAIPAGAQTAVKMISFGGAAHLPVWVAESKGLFEKEGLSIALDTATSSKQQIDDFLSGKYQFMTTAFDNIVAYAEGQGDVPQSRAQDIVAIMSAHEGMNSVVVRPEIADFAAIRGKAVAVDAVRSGYATVLYEILDKKAGLKFGKDYTVVAVGSTEKRMQAMEEKKAVAAIIATPADKAAEKKGYKILADATAAVGGYEASVYAVSRVWARAHEKEVMGFTRAMIEATDFVFADKAGAIAVLKAHMKRLSDDDADQLYTRLTGPGGLSPHAAISVEGVKKVLALREVWSEPKKKLGDPYKYIETGYQKKAAMK